jgi:hypothetical protein
MTAKVDKTAKRIEQRAEMRKAVINAGAESQVKISRERGRQRRSVEKTKTAQRVIERQQSEAARVQAYQQRSEIAVAQSETIRSARTSSNRQERIEKSVTGSSVWSTLIMLAALFFSMIVLYTIVRNGPAFGGLAGSMGSFISGLSSTKPLFIARAVASAPNTNTADTTTGGNTQVG